MNETDVRAEIAEPFLAALGYARGTDNNIAREFPLTYEREFLGRKKKSDPPLKGKPDYILTVTGSGRWVLETKPRHESIDLNAIDQAITYARVPEVSALYAVVLNGKRLTVHHFTQPSTDAPHIDLDISDPTALARVLESVLSPAAIRRDCTRPRVDLGLALASGLRSSAKIRGGAITHKAFHWTCNLALPNEAEAALHEVARRTTDLNIPIVGGSIYRDEESRIRARIVPAYPHEQMTQFMYAKRLHEIEYIALGDRISEAREAPTVFDVTNSVTIEEGEKLFDPYKWTTNNVQATSDMRQRGQVVGFIDGTIFRGAYSGRFECTFPANAALKLDLYIESTFEIEIDPA
jgi:hypothetical protein